MMSVSRTWALSTLLQASAACLVGVTGLVLVIKRDGLPVTPSFLSWLPGRGIVSEEDYTVPGLYNYSRNCFINVILQALASCSYFQSFLEEVMVESESLPLQERSEVLSLTESLDSLLQGLGQLSERRNILNPAHVMREITYHCPWFNLMVDQDPNEALGLLINSLREELSGCYVPNKSSLAIANALSRRILSPEVSNDQSEQERWQKHYLGPFNGIISGILTCQTCSTQLALDLESFYTIFAIPGPTNSEIGGRRFTLISCLRQYFGPQLEDRHCRHCWHAYAASSLSSAAKNVEEMKKVEVCSRGDSCECRSLPSLSNLPCLNSNSRVILKKRIARPPEILCIEFPRAENFGIGYASKLQGHIPFPLVLDLSPFISCSFAVEKLRFPEQHGHLRPAPFNTETERGGQRLFSNNTEQNINVSRAPEESRQSMQEELSNGRQAEGCSNVTKTLPESADKNIRIARKDFGCGPFYRLVSVVEHSGTGIDSGHYTVYRSVRSNPPEGGQPQDDDEVRVRWFHISDTKVAHASEEEVLAANAFMLFYERIPEKYVSSTVTTENSAA